jgi:hypothetical protein
MKVLDQKQATHSCIERFSNDENCSKKEELLDNLDNGESAPIQQVWLRVYSDSQFVELLESFIY